MQIIAAAKPDEFILRSNLPQTFSKILDIPDCGMLSFNGWLLICYSFGWSPVVKCSNARSFTVSVACTFQTGNANSCGPHDFGFIEGQESGMFWKQPVDKAGRISVVSNFAASDGNSRLFKSQCWIWRSGSMVLFDESYRLHMHMCTRKILECNFCCYL